MRREALKTQGELMDIYTLDFETYWAQDYTLSKMPCEEYVRDPRFKMHMVGVKLNGGATHVLSKSQFESLLGQGLRTKLNQSALQCQNTSFDAFILAHHYAVKPVFYLDTMSMFRAVYPHKRASLKVIAETLGLGAKGGESGYNVVNTRNKETLTAWEYQACAEYCKQDVELAWAAFQILKSELPLHELKLIDATIRMFTDPILVLNPVPLAEELEYERTRKAALLARVGEDKTMLASNPKFAGLLQSLGVVPPVKPSPTALKKDKELQEKVNSLKAEGVRLTPAVCEENEIPWAWAFGKSDVEFKHLLNHDDPMVVAAVEARLGVKSTIAETRAERFAGIAERGTLPVPLSYWGAATGRWAGADKLNLQNLQRGSRLRKAIEAPDGYLLAVCDLSAIEARVLAWIAGQDDALETYRTGGDIYCEMASKIYNRHVTKKDKQLRMVGKVAILGSGYSMGWRKFQEFVVDMAKMEFTMDDVDQLGVGLDRFLANKNNQRFIKVACPSFKNEHDFAVHCAVSEFIIQAYRVANYKIERLWSDAGAALFDIYQGNRRQVGEPEGVVMTSARGFEFPLGRAVKYAGLEQHQNGRRTEWTRITRDGVGHISPGLATENIVQALARHIMADQMLQLINEGYRVVLSCHDEIVLCEREDKAEAALRRMEQIMSTPPAWAVGLPLACEGDVAKSYGDAK